MAYDPTTAPLTNTSTEADINSANQWMWQQPWYQEAIRSFGQQMGNVKLNDNQKKQLAQVIAAHGFPLPSKDEIDPAGNVNPKGHKMRNFLIAAAIGGATIATLGAAGAFAGAGGALGGGGAAAGGAGAAAGGAALPASTIGLAGSGLGAIPATASTIGLAGGAAGAAGGLAPLASSTLPGLYSAPATITAGLPSGASAAGAGLSGVQGAGGGWGQIIGKMVKNPDTYSDIGKMLGSYANSEAGNRATTGHFTQDWDALRLKAVQDRRVAESDAMKKLAQTGYLGSGGNPYKPATMLTGETLPSFGFGPKAPSAAQLEASKTLEGQLLARLQPGAGFQPSPLESYTKPGTGEKIGRYGALIASGLGTASQFF